MSGAVAVAVVVGLCALSFVAGCVLTAVVLRRDPVPEPAPEPVVDAPAPRLRLQAPPEDYASRPIHRNPVMGIPTALPPPERSRPSLVLVPDPGPEAEHPVRQDGVRRMYVVPDVPEPAVETADTAGHGDAVEPAAATGPEPVTTEAAVGSRASAPDARAHTAEAARGSKR